MELRELLSKKPVKFLTLLLTAMLIASASAGVYYSLTMTSTIEVQATYVYFTLGDDSATANVNLSSDNRSAQLSLEAYPNVTTTYTDPIRVINNGTAPANVRLANVSASGSASDFVFVNFTLMGTSEQQLNFTVVGGAWTSSGPTDWMQLDATDPDTEWSIKIETKAATGATSGTATIEIKVDVE